MQDWNEIRPNQLCCSSVESGGLARGINLIQSKNNMKHRWAGLVHCLYKWLDHGELPALQNPPPSWLRRGSFGKHGMGGPATKCGTKTEFPLSSYNRSLVLRVEDHVGSGAWAQLTNCAEPASQGAGQVRLPCLPMGVKL